MPYHIAGTEVYTWALAKSMQRRGHEVNIVIPNYKSTEADTYEYDGLPVKRYPEPDNPDRLLKMGKRAPSGISNFKEIIKQLKPDIVHIQELAGSNGIGIYHLRVLKEISLKIVFTMHLAHYSCFCGTLMYKGKEHCSGLIDINRCTECALSRLPINNLTQKVLYNLSIPLYKINVNTGKLNHPAGTALSYPFIITQRKKTLHEIATICDNIIVLTDWYKTVLLKNGIAEDKLTLVKQALTYKADVSQPQHVNEVYPVRLIFIGRIDPLKGLHLLIEAMNDLPNEKIHLDIYGAIADQEYYNHWKQYTSDKKNINWKGILSQEEIVSTMSGYQALVLPSVFSEMSPLVIQEAFAAGIPVIGADVAGIAEQIKDRENGLLFNFNNVQSLKELLFDVLENPTSLSKLKKNIREPLDFETVVEQTLSVYRK